MIRLESLVVEKISTSLKNVLVYHFEAKIMTFRHAFIKIIKKNYEKNMFEDHSRRTIIKFKLLYKKSLIFVEYFTRVLILSVLFNFYVLKNESSKLISHI